MNAHGSPISALVKPRHRKLLLAAGGPPGPVGEVAAGGQGVQVLGAGWAVGTRRYRADVIRILVDNEDDRAAVLAAMERGRLTDLLLRPFMVAWNPGNLLPAAAGEDSPPAVESCGA